MTGLATLIACVVAAIGMVTTPSGDFRQGLFPWGIAMAFGLLAVGRRRRYTNPLERINKGIENRFSVVPLFPHEASVFRFVG